MKQYVYVVTPKVWDTKWGAVKVFASKESALKCQQRMKTMSEIERRAVNL